MVVLMAIHQSLLKQIQKHIHHGKLYNMCIAGLSL